MPRCDDLRWVIVAMYFLAGFESEQVTRLDDVVREERGLDVTLNRPIIFVRVSFGT